MTGCKVNHIETVPVKEVFRGETAWEGEVEVFDLIGHAKAKRCYAWGIPEDKGDGLEITTVLELPPVNSPQTAVKAVIMSEAERRLLVTFEKKDLSLTALQNAKADFDLDTPDGRKTGKGVFFITGREGKLSAKVSIKIGREPPYEWYHLSQKEVDAISSADKGRFFIKT